MAADITSRKDEATTADTSVPTTVRLGVTGHRTLGDEARPQAGVREVLARLDKLLGHTPHSFVVVSPLAEGADRLVAREVLAWSSPSQACSSELEVVLPLPEDDYLQDFETSESKDEYRGLARLASSATTLRPTASREAAYEQVGRYVVQHCDILIAIWNGQPAAGQGGTAEIVEHARKVGRTLYLVDSTTGELTLEKGADGALESLARLDAYNAESLGGDQVSKSVEDYHNYLTERALATGLSSDTTVSLIDPLRGNLLAQFIHADKLAGRYQDRHARAGSLIYALAALAVAIVAIQTLFFAQLTQLLWLEVAAIGTILGLLAGSRLGDWHRKWIDYRFLAERLRSAIFLHLAGVDCRPPEPEPPLNLSHRPNDWMVSAFAWIWGTRPQDRCDIMVPDGPLRELLIEGWIEDQRRYFEAKGGRHRRRHEQLSRAGMTLFALTLIVAGLHALGVGHSAEARPSLADGLAALAIALPAVGSALAGIRVHREYLRNAERYDQMVPALGSIVEQIRAAKDSTALVKHLTEANDILLRENQDWRVVLKYQRLEAA